MRETASVAAISIAMTMPMATYAGHSVQKDILQSVQNTPEMTTASVRLNNGQIILLDFYADDIVRIFRDPQGGAMRAPKASPEAEILVPQPRRALTSPVMKSAGAWQTARMSVEVNINDGRIKITDRKTGKVVVQEIEPAVIEKNHAEMTLAAGIGEYFYGGGMQNGRFSHRGRSIEIVNTNSWTDGGVASPNPFYWSTGGYGILWHTFKPGRYDFGSEDSSKVSIMHEEDYMDVFVMLGETPTQLLDGYYRLTGRPVLLPKFGFYEGHLNAYNRDFWQEATKPGEGILFEDGKRYVESSKDRTGTQETLNGENGTYKFSARAVIDRYRTHDMPLGWLLPNDGYGAGYGQTSSLDGNIENLRLLGEYANQNGVEIGLWTQSDLHPKEGVEPLLQRDIVKEVGTAGVRVLKTDVAWVGAGYSFGLNGVADVAQIMPRHGNGARPFIITLDGWAGTQRYAGLWSGDQTGGNWEYIRFHIPTYIGSGLSGQPNVSSDMDGIFGGKNVAVNVRDYQWKTYTPMELNMDGWGANEKYPQAMGEPATSINRMYLKMKSELMPYTYSIAHEATTGLPMVRAMLLHDANAYTLGKAAQYQFMYGPSLLVAPIYQATAIDSTTLADVRNGIYLPKGLWYDYFSGDAYTGGRIINNFATPLWKLPVFAKAGAILPLSEPSNNPTEINEKLRIYEVYPGGHSEFTEYDDDGRSTEYLHGMSRTTLITAYENKGKAVIRVAAAKGKYHHEATKATEVRINATSRPKKVTAKVGGKKVKLTEVKSLEEFRSTPDAYFYCAAPEMNRFSTPGSEFAKVSIRKNPQIMVRTAPADIFANEVEIMVSGFELDASDKLLSHKTPLAAPKAEMADSERKPYSLMPAWQPVSGADYYEVEFDSMLYSTIRDNHLLFTDLTPKTDYAFRVRAVNAAGKSPWTLLAATTADNPLEFAIKGITATTTCENQGGQDVDRLFNFDESDTWHSKWGDTGTAVPFTIDIDLRSINTIDKLKYLAREDGGNGTLLRGSIAYALNSDEWSAPVPFEWRKDGSVKEFAFTDKPQARYIRINVSEAVGNFGSGRELYVFKVPGTETTYPGDINRDKRIDMDDFTSYMNYTGLRRGDKDFEGYVSGGDINRNGLIDAYDISVVGTQVRGGVDLYGMKPLSGTISVMPDKQTYQAGDEVTLTVSGKGMSAINALSFALPYSTDDIEYVGTEATGMLDMENLTTDRLHSNGTKALYPTFVNTGDKALLEGDATLMKIRFKAKRAFKYALKVQDGMIVDKALGTKPF